MRSQRRSVASSQTAAASATAAGRRGPARKARREPAAAVSAPRARRVPLLLLTLLLGAVSASCVTVSRQEEIDLGREYARQINEELPLIPDSTIRGRVSDVGLEIARLSPRPDLPYEFQVVNTDVVNAFAVPGGFIYMNRGLIEDSENMSEVAGVLAHEVAHVVARHSAEQIERARRAQLGLVGLAVVLGQPSDLAQVGINVAANLYFAKHSREAEAEADSLAVGFMVEAGWDPRGLVSFFHTMMENRERKPRALEALFTSHPLTEDRIQAVEDLIGALPQERLEGLETTGASYAKLKKALAAYPPPPEKYRSKEKKKDGGSEGEEGAGS